jgi:hypothetical protein
MHVLRSNEKITNIATCALQYVGKILHSQLKVDDAKRHVIKRGKIANVISTVEKRLL